MSTMKDTRASINKRIAGRVRSLRMSLGLSLDALANKTGVSRSMLSLIERGESSPTAVILEKLAAGLGVTLASLFDAPNTEPEKPRGPISRREDQLEWQDPASGYVRRNVSPPHAHHPMQISEIYFPAGARVAFETGPRDRRVVQQIWILEGVMEITVGKERHRLRKGDCVAMQLDRPTLFHNPTRRRARYAVVIASEPISRR
jgi:transcriptional regulator with XRE-family HTH domain